MYISVAILAQDDFGLSSQSAPRFISACAAVALSLAPPLLAHRADLDSGMAPSPVKRQSKRLQAHRSDPLEDARAPQHPRAAKGTPVIDVSPCSSSAAPGSAPLAAPASPRGPAATAAEASVAAAATADPVPQFAAPGFSSPATPGSSTAAMDMQTMHDELILAMDARLKAYNKGISAEILTTTTKMPQNVERRIEARVAPIERCLDQTTRSITDLTKIQAEHTAAIEALRKSLAVANDVIP
eukprot:2280402-Heterocapsa_arctica.AAC.1